MPQHDYLSKLPLNLPETRPKTDDEWRVFTEQLRRYFNAMSNISLKSGTITNPDDPSGLGYWIGWDNSGKIAAMFGDFDNENYIRFSQALSAFILGKNTVVQQGDDIVYLVFGTQTGSARDGDTVTFDPAFPDDIVPKVIFGIGGKTYDNTTLGAVDQSVQVQPLNLTNEGFTMSAKIYGVGVTTTETLSFTSGVATKIGSAEAFDDNYRFTYDVSIPVTAGEPAFVTLGFYARPSGGTFTKYATENFVNNTGATKVYSGETKTISVDGLAANSEFKIVVESGTATVTPSSLVYETASVTSVSATPSGASPIPWVAIAAR